MHRSSASLARLAAMACASAALVLPTAASASDTAPGIGALSLIGSEWDRDDIGIDPGLIAAETEEELAGLGWDEEWGSDEEWGEDLPPEAGDGPAPGTDGRPMTILYDMQEAVWDLVYPKRGAGLTPERGVFRQDPGPGGLFSEDGNDSDHRVGKVSAKDLVRLSAERMAERLKREIDEARFRATSHVVAVDEIGNAFNDGRVKARFKKVTVRGQVVKVRAHHRVVLTRTGYKVEKGRAPLPKIEADSPGARLSRAMEILDVPSPWGGTYAERVHLYTSPAFGASIGTGHGKHRHLGRDGNPHRATWRGVMPALARAGGVWIEMYHYSRAKGTYSMSAREWKLIPARFSSYHRSFGGDVDRLHLVFTGATRRPAGAPRSCGAPMACQWKLARSTKAGRTLLDNGPAAYRLGRTAGEFLREFNRHLDQ